jgi:hypothetical protein
LSRRRSFLREVAVPIASLFPDRAGQVVETGAAHEHFPRRHPGEQAMHTTLILLTAAAVGMAAPALAQQPVRADTKAGERALLDENVVTVRNVTRAELVYGLPIMDDEGIAIGNVERVAGNDVIVSDGTAEYRVPFTQIYAFSKDGADHYASRTPKQKLHREPNAPAN